MLEKLIEQLIAALNANTTALREVASAKPAPAADAPAKPGRKPKDAPAPAAETPATPPPAPAPAPEPAPAAKAPEYPTQEALVEAANKFIELSNPDALACFAGIKEKFKVEKVRLVKPEDRAAAIKLIEDAVAAFKTKNAASDV